MSTGIDDRPVKILTPFRQISQENWPGEVPVEFLYTNDQEEMAAMIPEADVLLSMVFTKEMAAAAARLKLIQCAGAGYDKIDLTAVPQGCVVANVYEHERPMAEWVIMSMIALDRELIRADKTLREGSWEMSGYHNNTYPDLDERTLGIIGLGRIGRRVAELAKAFNMRLVAATRTVPLTTEAGALGFDYIVSIADIDQVLEEADFLLLTLSLNDTTQNLIGERELALMKPTANLINVARAEVVDEMALYNALKSKQIKGAALDVWYQEPTGPDESPLPANQPFWELDNVIMSPHVSAVTTGLIRRRLVEVAKNVDRLARGEPVLNIVG